MYCPCVCRKQLKEILRFIIQRDYPKQWDALHTQLAQFLQSNDPAKIEGALVAAQVLTKSYRYGSGEHRQQRQVIADALFPILTQLFQYLCANDQIVNFGNVLMAQMRRHCAKIFWALVQDEIPNHLIQHTHEFEQWMALFVAILDSQIPAEVDSDSPFWKTKKWICHTAYKLICNFIAPEFLTGSAQKKFAQYFLRNHAVNFLKSFMTILQRCNQGQYTPVRHICLALYYINTCTANAKIFKELIQPQLKPMIEHIIFPLLHFTDEEQELWEEDPGEYIFKSFDVVIDLTSTKIAAMNVVSDLLKRKRETVPIILGMVSDYLNNYAQLAQKTKQSIAVKEACLYILGNIRPIIRRDPNLLNSMEDLLVVHVFPELDSKSAPVLRAKACWLAGKYCKLPWKQIAHFENALKATLQCMYDTEQPVRLMASIAINKMVDHPYAENIIRPVLPQLIQAYLKIMNEIDQDDLVESLSVVVDCFADEMGPYTVGLCTAMTDHFIKLFEAGRNADDFDDDDEGTGGNAGFIAQHCLQVVCTMLKSLTSHQDRAAICQQLEMKLLTVVDTTLQEDGFEYLEQGLEILMHLTYMLPVVTDACWTLYPRILESIQSYAYNFVSSALYPIDNYISRGTDRFLSDHKNMELLLVAMRHYLGDKESNEAECQSASLILSVVLQHCVGRVDAYLGAILELIVGRLHTVETNSLKTILLDTVADALIYNAALTIQVMEQRGWTQFVFSAWFSHLDSMQRVFDKKMTVLGLSAILSMDNIVQSLPMTLQQNIPHIVSGCVNMLQKMQEQKEREEQEKAEIEKEREELMEKARRGELEDLWDENDYLDDGDDDDFDDGEEEAEEFYEEEEGDANVEAQGLLEARRQKFIASVAQFDNLALGLSDPGGDAFVEEDVHDTPINSMDETSLFVQSMHKLRASYGEHVFSSSAISLLSEQQKIALQHLMQQ